MPRKQAEGLPEPRFREWKEFGPKLPRFHTSSRKKFAESVSDEGRLFYKQFLARWGKLMDSKNCRDQFHEMWTTIEQEHGLEKNLLKRKYKRKRSLDNDEESDDEGDEAVQVTPTTVVLEGEDGYEEYVRSRDADYASDCDMD